ncbi:restriction endonuclease subunit S [Furfurilactobacillus milii]|uniref:Restriction endonuclease subunit S n=2 Tax=Furfurilactobacillus milii TaxID=2888272 RepID=A0ABT6DCQ0_9LACO|nr:restriction endonuclease subunit S [Furfurilactobacillus milii]MDF9914917.1 restriction endonuclease subunit S [Furfurilactobacillus milii]
MNANQAKYPQLRFKGFTDHWEQRKLGKMGYTFTGLSGKTKEDFGHGNAKFVTYMNVFSSPVSNSEMVENVEVDSKQHQVEYGDVFFTTSSETPQEVGMSSVWLETAENIYLNSFCFGYHPMVEFDPYYLAFMLRSPVIRKKFMLLAQGISRYNISKNKVMEMLVPVPEIVEQQKIGSFFKELDDTITLHQRKLAKLKELKQGYLQKLFPENGSKFPQLRFAGFADAWKQRKLSDFSKTTYGGGTPKTAVTEYWDGNIPWIQSSNLTVDDVQEVNLDKFITDDAIKNSAAKLIPANSIAIVTRVGVGKLTLMKQEFATSQDFLSLSELHVDEQFGLYSIYKLLQKELNNIQGTSIKGMTKADLLTKDIMIPVEKDEQIKIGSFFKQLDHLITLHQRKLKKLQELKKGYLQKMFC